MKAYIPLFAFCIGLTANARAQSSGETAAASSVTTKELDTNKGARGATSDVQASPDVQKQVGIGTEKQTPNGAATPAAAQAQGEKAEQQQPQTDPYSHQMQFGIRLGYVFGYRIVFRYDQSPFCTKPDKTQKSDDAKKICGFVGPPTLDVALSFAPLGSVEPYLWGRFGLSSESDTDTKPLRVFGAGARIYTASDSRFKFFFEPALGFELEHGGGSPDYYYTALDGEAFVPKYKKDVFFHIGFGPQYDFLRYAGVYLNLGADVGVLRDINNTLEVQGGLQARFP